MELHEKNCILSTKETPALNLEQKTSMLELINSEWQLTHSNTRLFRDFKFNKFIPALEFANQIGSLAEQQRHHPEIHIGWGHCGIEIWTHTINELVESDFILAAKIDRLYRD